MFDSGSNLVAIMIVVVIVPVALVAPTMAVFIPPTVRMFPTVGTRFGKFVAPMFRLRTLPTMVFDSLVELVVRMNNALLAVVVSVRSRSREEQSSGKSQAEETRGKFLRFEFHSFSRYGMWFRA